MALHFHRFRRLLSGPELDPVERAQLEIVERLVRGLDPAAPLTGAITAGQQYDLWDAGDRFVVWVLGGELVAFLAGTHTLVNYTIQSSLELDDAWGFSSSEWTHDCQGADCPGCGLPG